MDSHEQPAAERDAATVGPLDGDTLRPMRTLLGAKIAAMVVLALVALFAGVLLAPQVAAGLGLAPRVAATVTDLAPLPASDSAPGGCLRVRTHVEWSNGNRGMFVVCAVEPTSGPIANDIGTAEADGDPAGGAVTDVARDSEAPDAAQAAETARVDAVDVPGEGRTSVGDTVSVSALSGWSSVVIGPRWPNTVLTIALVLVILTAVAGFVRYRRERRQLTALAAAPISAAPMGVTRTGLTMAFDVLTMGTKPGGGRGRRAMVRLEFDDAAAKPLRLQIPGATDEAMDWRRAELFPVGRTKQGTPAGPYVVRTARGTLLASGRAVRYRA